MATIGKTITKPTVGDTMGQSTDTSGGAVKDDSQITCRLCQAKISDYLGDHLLEIHDKIGRASCRERVCHRV